MIEINLVGGKWSGKFNDVIGAMSVIEETSSAPYSKPGIWLGNANYRMKLDQGMVKELIPLLQHFVDTGKIKPKPYKPPPTRDDYNKLLVATAKTVRDKLVGVRDSALDKALEPFED